jgi:NAD(P)-dependent dehydrogenase (short-subunit alcohol dehydrogenase family)
VGSVAGRNAMPLLGPYCASKHAIEAIVAALRMELASSGIQVALVEPGTFRTPLWQRSDDIVARVMSRLSPAAMKLYGPALDQLRKTAAATGSRGTPASKFGEAVADAVESTRLKRRYVLGGDARLQLLLGATPMRIREPLIGHVLRLATAQAAVAPEA